MRSQSGSSRAEREPFEFLSFAAVFEIFVETAGGTKKLRDLIIHLGLSGRLSSHVRAEQISDETSPPEWLCERLDEAADWASGSGFPKRVQGHQDGPFLFCKVSDMNLPGNERFIISTVNTIDERTARSVRAKVHPAGTVIFPKIGGAIATNKRRILSRPGAIDNNCLGLVPNGQCESDFLILLMQSIDLVQYQNDGPVPALNQARIGSIKVPLPPIAEQRLIVAKVDELMRLLDDLEAKQTKKRETQARLRSAALGSFTAIDEFENLKIAWRSIADNFGLLIEQPESVFELRRALLELAVRGRLSQPDSNDEPIAILCERIERERERLIVGRRSGGRGLATDRNGELVEPYAIPAGWRWVWLADVAGHIVDGTHHTPSYQERGIAFISAKDIKEGSVLFDKCKYISRAEFDELRRRCQPRLGDVLVTKSGSIGEVAVVTTNHPFTLFESVALVPIVEMVDSQFAAYVVYLGASGKFGRDNQKGVAVRHLHLVDLRRLPFPLPPLAEQRRIVAKIEHLMQLCDDLEAKLRLAEDTRSRLADAIVAEVNSSGGKVRE